MYMICMYISYLKYNSIICIYYVCLIAVAFVSFYSFM